MLKFGQTIKQKREEKGWTQKELAQRLYVSDKAVSRWENNQSYPDITLLLEIASVLEFDYQELLEGQKYVERQLKAKKKRRNIFVVSMILAIFSIIIFNFSMNQKNEDLGKNLYGIDFLNSMKWSQLSIQNDTDIPDFVEPISEYQSQTVLDYLGVDTWEKVEFLPSDAKRIYDLQFENNIKLEQYVVYEANQKYYIAFTVDFYYGEFFHKMTSTGTLTKFNQIYSCDNDLSNLRETLLQIPEFEFIYDHPFENLTDFRILTEQEIKNMKKPYYKHDESRDILGGRIFLSKDGPFYIYFTSNEIDVQKVSYEYGILYLEGEPRKYSKPYVCILEIRNPDEFSQIRYNGERIVSYGYDFRNN